MYYKANPTWAAYICAYFYGKFPFYEIIFRKSPHSQYSIAI